MTGRIEDYALLGDLHTAALVSLRGSVDWLCVPRFDSPSCFTALLGEDDNGHWSLAPTDPTATPRRRYVGDTLVLETTWTTRTGVIQVLDFMPPLTPAPDMVRIVVGVSGEVEVESVLRARFDYGRSVPWVTSESTGNGYEVRMVAGPDSLYLRTPVETHGHGLSTVSRTTVKAGGRVPFTLLWHPSHEYGPDAIDPEAELERTLGFWDTQLSACTYTGEHRDAVVRSLATLKALTYAPTGGIVAAPTTSLPEFIGGVRNWDYRFCWLRDSTLTLSALLSTGFVEEAWAWREWLLRAIGGNPKDLQIMYAIDGSRRLPEYELDHLRGYEGSRPVRVGNLAVDQLQLDVYGETIDSLHLAEAAGLPMTESAWALQTELLNHLESAWDAPDEGIWEVRGPRRHFVHSRVMSWVAFDRMSRRLRAHGGGPQLKRWERTRDGIHAEVLARGFNAEVGAFTQSYDSPALDAAALVIPQVGFLPYSDPRVVSTVERVRDRLSTGGLVMRYETSTAAHDSTDDGLPEGEGAFLACSFWLVEALAKTGHQDQGRELFEHLLSLRNDVGLLAEEYDPVAKRQVGNFPQAFSHVPLVTSALALDEARRSS